MKKKNLTLLVLAAGMGSRFGGLKQIEPVGPHGEFIIDYSIYDALHVGFNKIVFVIKKENQKLFDETIGNRLKNKIKIKYVYQELEDLPDEYIKPLDRTKPWGTAQAVYAGRNVINEPFAIINSDDFYGRDAFKRLSNFLINRPDEYCIIGYKVKNTLAESGAVKRGLCHVKDDKLLKIIESKVEKENGLILAKPLDGSNDFEVQGDTLVSMNMIGFAPNIFSYIEKGFHEFLRENHDNILECEYLIPDVVNHSINEGLVNARVVSTTSVWAGMTHREDKEKVINTISELIDEGIYPENLWNE